MFLVSIIVSSRLHPIDPPPGSVHELAERTVEYVRRALGLTLDYTPETLPVLDHYLSTVPTDQPETVRLIAATAGAYFGEVVRRTLGGTWEDRDDAASLDRKVRVSGDVSFAPAAMAALAVLHAESDDIDASTDVPERARELVEQALEARGRVPEDEFYSLSGRLEVLMFVVDLVVGSADRPVESDE
jgi:hypothetical protein